MTSDSAASSGLSPSPYNPRTNGATSPPSGLSASPLRDATSRSLSSTLSSRTKSHVASSSVDRVPLSVAALAALPAAERIKIEHQFQEDKRKHQVSRPTSGRIVASPVTAQSQRRQQQAVEVARKQLEEHQRLQERLAAAEVRKQNSGRAATKVKPSPWATAPDQRSQFQVWNREGSLPQFVVSSSHRDRAPAVGTYGKSTSIALTSSTTDSSHGGGGLSTPRCGSCNRMESSMS
ncbi:Hypothetical protein, putative [Bodo saltans]|uniref:Uncharacterized protein n=1 Tax=Bodo saltans TaxID=75058 RepID=A0A0S4IT24_BODSA|nr:Hypothetical protein, putative [Bodo saltans]|eukprot:CUF66393.1 Hypothetical protein, putative [Bodo saltans]